MAKASKSKNTGDKIPQIKKPGRSKKGTLGTKDRVRLHIEDEKDVITEADIENVKLDLGVPTDHAHQPLPIENDENRPHDEDKDKTKVTPWDVIE